MENNQQIQKQKKIEQTHYIHEIIHKVSLRTYIIIGIFFIFCLGILLFIKTINLYPLKTQPFSPTQQSPRTGCAKVTGPLTQAGTKILQNNGSDYIPYGITVSGLSGINYQGKIANDNAQIQAAANTWCSNTVRLQIGQDNLVGKSGTSFSQSFMHAIKNEVKYAESLGLIVVINDQTESVGFEKGPTESTISFWKTITQAYGNDPQVIFDLFNESRVNKKNSATTWQLWQKGGTYQGIAYFGMQDLVNKVRMSGAKNLLWIEGPYTSSTLSDVVNYPVTGEPLMYAIHHPKGEHNSQTWETDFGFLITQNIAPVVEGEWSNYTSNKSECWRDAPTAIPQFLSYLQGKRIGMTVWTLRKGVMLESNNFSDPTQIKSNWACKDGLNEGAGQIVLNWYKSQN